MFSESRKIGIPFLVLFLIATSAFAYVGEGLSEKQRKQVDQLTNATLHGEYRVEGGLEKEDVSSLLADTSKNPKNVYFFTGYRSYIPKKSRWERFKGRLSREKEEVNPPKSLDEDVLCFFGFVPPDVYTVAFINKQGIPITNNPFRKRFSITLYTKDQKTYFLHLPDIGQNQAKEDFINLGDMAIGSILLEDEIVLSLLKDHKIDYAVLKYDEGNPSGEYVLKESPINKATQNP